jgi:hypothetical protein
MRELLTLEPTYAEGTGDELAPRCLTLTPDAYDVWVKIHDALEEDQAEGGLYASISAWASKGASQVLRVAGVLTLVEDPSAGVIQRDTIMQAFALVQWHLGEALRIVGTGQTPPGIRNAAALLQWCHAQRVELLCSSHALNRGPSSIRAAPDFERAMELLVRQGWVVPVAPCEVDGKLRRKVWRIVRVAA